MEYSNSNDSDNYTSIPQTNGILHFSKISLVLKFSKNSTEKVKKLDVNILGVF